MQTQTQTQKQDAYTMRLTCGGSGLSSQAVVTPALLTVAPSGAPLASSTAVALAVVLSPPPPSLTHAHSHGTHGSAHGHGSAHSAPSSRSSTPVQAVLAATTATVTATPATLPAIVATRATLAAAAPFTLAPAPASSSMSAPSGHASMSPAVVSAASRLPAVASASASMDASSVGETGGTVDAVPANAGILASLDDAKLELQITRRVERRYQEKLELLKCNFEDRLRQIADTLASASIRMSTDVAIDAMKDDPDSLQFAQVRAVEILQEEISMDRERLVATLLQTTAERTAERDQFKTQLEEEGRSHVSRDAALNAELRRESALRIESDARLKQLEQSLESTRNQRDTLETEISRVRALLNEATLRAKIQEEQAVGVQRHMQQVERARERDEKTSTELREQLDARIRELNETQQALSTAQLQGTHLQRESESASQRAIALETEARQLAAACTARDKRIAQLDDARLQLVDKVGALGSALQRVESERNELRKKYLSVGDKVETLLRTEAAESAQAAADAGLQVRRLQEALGDERRLRAKERQQLTESCTVLEHKAVAAGNELRAAEEAVRLLQIKVEQAQAYFSLEKRSQGAGERALREQLAQVEAELKSQLTAHNAIKMRLEQQLMDKDAAVARATAALDARVRDHEAAHESQMLHLQSRLDAEQRKLHQKYQSELETKLSEMRSSYEARLAVATARESQAREIIEQRCREHERAWIEQQQALIDARELSATTQASRDKADAVRRVEAELKQQLHEVRERGAEEFKSAVGALRAQVKAAEQAADGERATRTQMETQLGHERQALMEIRARLDRSERASEEASKEKKNLDSALDEAQRNVARLKAALEDEQTKRRAVERKSRFDADDRIDSDEAVNRARRQAAAVESDRQERRAECTRLTDALRVATDKAEDASKRFERTRELLAASEAEKAQVVQAFQERLHASKLDIERVHLECNERLLRQQQDLAATETERRTLQTQLEGAQHELAETRRAATDAVAREGARGHHALDQVASNAQAAETRVAALHARLDEALGLREQHIKKIAHLEQAFEASQAALKRQRVAAEGHRRVVSTFASKQLNELVAENHAMRAALLGGVTRLQDELANALADWQRKTRLALQQAASTHAARLQSAVQEVEGRATVASREAAQRLTAQVAECAQERRELALKHAAELQALQLQHPREMEQLRVQFDAVKRESDFRDRQTRETLIAEWKEKVQQAKLEANRLAEEAFTVERRDLQAKLDDLKLQLSASISDQHGTGRTAVQLERDLQRVREERLRLDLQLETAVRARDDALRAGEVQTAQLAHVLMVISGELSIPKDLQKTLLKTTDKDEFTDACRKFHELVKAYAFQSRQQYEQQLERTKAQLSSTVEEKEQVVDRLQSLKQQYSKMQADYSQKEQDQQRLQSELETMQHELLLASELSSVSAVQPYRAELETLRKNLSTLEASHRQVLDAKDAEFEQRLKTLHRQFQDEIVKSRGNASSMMSSRGPVDSSDDSLQESSLDADLSTDSRVAPTRTASFPSHARDDTFSSGVSSMGSFGSAGSAALRLSAEALRLRSLTAAVKTSLAAQADEALLKAGQLDWDTQQLLQSADSSVF